MKHIAPTLTAIALMGAAPAFGASIADDLVIKPKAQIQVRAQFGAGASNTAGDDFNIYNGATGDTESVRFSIRRARFGAEAKNSTGWFGVFQIRAGERVDAGARSTYIASVTPTVVGGAVTGVTTTTGDYATNKTRTAELYYANIGKTWKQDSFEVEVRGGLDKPFNGESSISSSNFLFPMDRPNAAWTEYRDTGIGAKVFVAEMVRVGFDVQNGTTTLSPDANSEAAGLFTSFRLELSPGKDFMPAKKTESFYGSEGHHLVLGFDYQNDDGRLTTVSGASAPAGNDATTSVSTLGPDLLYHFNGLTALADLRMRTTKVENSVGASPDDVKGQVWTIQAAYAVPLEAGFAIEPAARFSKIDLNKDNDEEGPNPFNQGEYRTGQSGTEFTIGINAYWNGHANKTQLAYTSWKGEDAAAGADAADAHVITLQQQVTF